MDDTREKHRIAAIGVAALLGMTSIGALAGGLLAIEFDSNDFPPAPLVIDNPYWPLLPAGVASRTFTYAGETDDECVINTISIMAGDTKVLTGGDYAGFEAQVVRDEEWAIELEDGDACDAGTPTSDDDLTELTFDWYAQDLNGNIWYLGEDSRSFEDGCPPLGSMDPVPPECTEGSWEAGQPGPEEGLIGQAGIVVPADLPFGPGGEPLAAGTFYAQELAEGAEDMAKILRLDAPVTVEEGQFEGDRENCRKVKEWTLLEPGQSVEHKYYCGGVGLLLINGLAGGPTESEVLVEMTSAP